jgi:ATP-dependent Clp protease ATP-binding subunit ClpC
MTDAERMMTDRARQVMTLAEQEAWRLGTATIEPKPVLLGLYVEGAGVAAHALRNLGVSTEQIERALPAAGPARVGQPERLPWSTGTERTVARAHAEMVPLCHNYVGTEHLLLGVVLAGEGAVPGVLARLKVTPDAVQREVYNILGHDL